MENQKLLTRAGLAIGQTGQPAEQVQCHPLSGQDRLRVALARLNPDLPAQAQEDALRRITPGAGGELQLTDAIALLIAEGEPVHVVVHHGTRHDLGNPGGYLKAAVDFALDRDDYGPELREWLVKRLAED